MSNPNNYTGSTVSIVGYAGGEYEVKKVGSSELAELSIGVSKGYKNKQTNEWVDQGTDWYTLQATANYASDNWPYIGKGDKVRVDDGKLTARVYGRNNGEPGLELLIRYGTVEVVESKDSGGF